MKLFMLKSLMIAAVMFISVLAGMQLANDGIHKLRGYDDPEFENTTSLTDMNHKTNISLFGNDVSSHDLQAKKKKLEKMNAFNIFSTAGKKMSDGISKTSEKILNSIAN
ncbi:DUF3679 domain-containing protein [Neobacillus sp. PS3-40]|jgi:hypothetical protein|uniref:DUF3679 domain-containing protein n=1 Tax=Neobacillus sp. PS3-40 TaxID=3070679 RepID=UPI0027E20A93|nr:DUF3679 domain-containing protein [Neobacillus sp. PS3-40]WML45366.1 DUF3679 domain-containing protein [Neobacillus sp. PS3-40]